LSEVAIHKGEGARPEGQFAGAPAQAHGFDSHEHAHGGHHGPAHLHHHFTDTAQQRESNALGMWVFMVTEVMTFGALFFVYTLYRHLFENQAFEAGYASPFAVGSELLDNGLGFINTLVLLVSSLTVATAVHAAGMRNRKLLLTMFTVTWILGAVFLGIKAVEWKHDYDEGLVPGLNWNPRTTLTHYGYVMAESTGVNGQAFLPNANLDQNNIPVAGPEALKQSACGNGDRNRATRRHWRIMAERLTRTEADTAALTKNRIKAPSTVCNCKCFSSFTFA
jgi:cytochrome c oxidase subunit 3